MVWQFQALAYPTLVDFSMKNLLPIYRIKLKENEDINNRFIYGELIGLYNPTETKPYNILLNEEKGLVRQIQSRFETKVSTNMNNQNPSRIAPFLSSSGVKNAKIIGIQTKNVGLGDFDDFKDIGLYAVNRFLYIATEASQPPSTFSEHLDEFNKRCAELMRKDVDSLDFAAFQQYICQTFYRIFTRVARERVGLSIKKRGFTAQQVRDLISLVEPLIE